MNFPSVFDKKVTEELITRVNKLEKDKKPKWGKMSPDQMLAHVNVSYRYVFEEEAFKKNSAFKKFLLRIFLKGVITGTKPYKKNTPTAPDFKMTDSKVFEDEKRDLIKFIEKVQSLGVAHFEGKESHSIGKLTAEEWNAMFYKHLVYHLEQFDC